MKINKLLMCAAMLLLGNMYTLAADEKLPAFPGAEGYGRYTTGGRGGHVYAVTNLNDSGEGSLRWALSQPGPRTIVFNVDGTIHLNSALAIPSNTTIAGQTAPGMGVCVADYPFSIGGSNVIVRYMRIRLGNKNVTANGADGWDGFGSYEQTDIIIDHCSVSWSIDECLSVYGNINSTVQWCISAQSLVNSGHSKGAHGYGCIWGGSGASFHHNLLAHHSSRMPRLGGRPWTQLDERVDMRNNVFYNWAGEGSYGYEAQKVNIVNNYFKQGPGTATQSSSKRLRVAAPGIRTESYVAQYPAYAPALHIWGKYYVDGNANFSSANKENTGVRNNNWTYVYNQIEENNCDGTYTAKTRDTIKLAQPIPFVYTTTHNTTYTYTYVTSYAGACKGGVWDAVDEQIINDTKKGTATATGDPYEENGKTVTPGQGFINSQDDNKAIVEKYGSAWPTLTEGEKWVDSDGDGMPDSWETTNKLNPNDAADGNATTLSSEGYTNLEVYMNSLVADITAKCTELTYNGGTVPVATVEGQEDVPESSIGKTDDGDEGDESNAQYYIITATDIINPGTVITSIEGVTLTYPNVELSEIGTKGNYADSNFKNYINAASDNGKFTPGSKAENGFTFQTTKKGSITAGIILNADKNLRLVGSDFYEITPTSYNLPSASGGESQTLDADKKVAAKAYGTITWSVENGGTYYLLAQGTKLGFYGFKFEEATTGIEAVKSKGSAEDGYIYNLQGVRVSSPQKGIYIRNGKKFVIK